MMAVCLEKLTILCEVDKLLPRILADDEVGAYLRSQSEWYKQAQQVYLLRKNIVSDKGSARTQRKQAEEEALLHKIVGELPGDLRQIIGKQAAFTAVDQLSSEMVELWSNHSTDGPAIEKNLNALFAALAPSSSSSSTTNNSSNNRSSTSTNTSTTEQAEEEEDEAV
jgi:hypothetical protein